jgi:hypothetical protein
MEEIDRVMNLVFWSVAAMLSIGLFLLVHGTIVKNRWGINLHAIKCPRCHLALSQVRIPKTLSQALWGGWTCPRCGCSSDKWGREVQARADYYPGWRIAEPGRFRVFLTL